MIATQQITGRREAVDPHLLLVDGSADLGMEEAARRLHPVEQEADEVKVCT